MTVKHEGVTYTVTEAGTFAFYSCTALKSLTLPNSVKIIRRNAISLCRNLAHLDLGTGVETLEQSSIGSLISLKNFRLPPNVVNLDKQCISLTIDTIYIPASVKNIAGAAFYSVSKNVSFKVDANNTVYKSVGDDILTKDGTMFVAHPRYNTTTTLNIPETVTKIGPYAFYGCEKITSPINLSDKVKHVCTWAFSSCKNVPEVHTGGAVEIEEFAFAWLSRGVKLTLAPALRIIGANAFESFGGSTYKTIDSTLVIPATVQYIGPEAFTSYSFPKLKLSEGIETVDTMAFSGMAYLTQLSLPSTLKRVNMLGFRVASRLTAINLPAALTYIGDGAFIGANKVPDVTIGKNVTYVGKRAFAQCTALNDINVDAANPNFASLNGVLYNKDLTVLKTYPSGRKDTTFTVPLSVNTLEGGAFAANTYLRTVELHSGITTLGVGVWQQCSGLTRMNFPVNGPSELPEATFLQCTRLSSITLPKTIKSIGAQCFQLCTNLTAITIPSRVESIGENAFYCATYPASMASKLVSITVHNRKPCVLSTTSFVAKNYSGTLYVPKGCVDVYQSAEIWKNFKNIVEDPTSVELNTDEQGNITVNGGNGQITVNGADDAVISVYNLSGIAVYQGHDSVISGLTKGVYLVRVADKTFKVAI